MTRRRERIAQVIAEYDAQGGHRTATETDARSGEWLAEQVRRLGLEPRLEEVELNRLEPVSARLELEGRVVEGLPLFDGGATPPEGVAGRLGPLGGDTPLALLEMPVAGPAPQLHAARRTGAHEVLVALTRGNEPGLAPRNAPRFSEPFGPPVLQVGSEHEPLLRAFITSSAATGLQARATVTFRGSPATAWNVTCTVPGSQTGLAPLVVMTPRSGWWNCAGERGGGLACWLEVMAALAARPGKRDVHFVASTGHELGHLGLRAYLASRDGGGGKGRDNADDRAGNDRAGNDRAGWAARAHAWIHLGASIGAAPEPRVRCAASDEALEEIARDAFVAAGAPAPPFVPLGGAPAGEAAEIHQRGGRYISLAGGFARFHLASDRWPDSVNVNAVEKYAAAFTDMAARLAELGTE